MKYRTPRFCLIVFLLIFKAAHSALGAESLDGVVAKNISDSATSGTNLLTAGAWRPWGEGFVREGDLFVCDNGTDGSVQRGLGQTVTLNQEAPAPITAVAWSRAENVSGGPDSDYSLYLDLEYMDGTPLWGQVAYFSTGTHNWERREVRIIPERPVKYVSFYLLLRRHYGKVWFRDPSLSVTEAAQGAFVFDGVAVSTDKDSVEGFQIRDLAGPSDFVHIEKEALGVSLKTETTRREGATMFDVTVEKTSGADRAITLYYITPFSGEGTDWLDDPRRRQAIQENREYINAARFKAGANGRLSRYPFGAISRNGAATALGIDMATPAFFRVGYNSGAGELFIAYDLALTNERPTARLRFSKYTFDEAWGFRSALDRYYRLYPESFKRRIDRQGLWMPFKKISEVEGWSDFGFRFKEGNNEPDWDDAHDILTFRYTEPMTWWMDMSPELPRTYESAMNEARRLAEAGNRRAMSLLTSGFHDADGAYTLQMLDRPWSDGAVWSMNAMPGITGEVTEFKNKWNAELQQSLYGSGAEGGLDGEYIDSSEGYVTSELDYRRDHFAASQTPLTFGTSELQPAIFRGLIAFEYIRGIEQDIHGMGRYMMANSTPINLCWLTPLLDVVGSETNWNPGGEWRPMSDEGLLYRRALCKGKPYCFLMNTEFENFSHALVERYMKRCLAYGMFPGFFSHNAAEGHYFSRSELYNRDRPLFKKYVPLCRKIAEAGWEPITLARSSDPLVRVERFGKRFLTVLNDSDTTRSARIVLEGHSANAGRELLSSRMIKFDEGSAEIILGPEDVAALQLNLKNTATSIILSDKDVRARRIVESVDR